MSLEITLSFISLAGLAGMSFILFKKIPALLEMQEAGLQKGKIISGIKENVKKGIRKIPGAKKIDYELYLQKVLSKIRVLTMKAEGKTGNWLERLRQKRNGHNHDNTYWEELKKVKDGK